VAGAAGPEDCGGLGGSLIDISLILESMGRFFGRGAIRDHTILCAHLIDACGDTRRRAELLGAITSGELRVALAHGEDGTRYDLDRTSVRARASSQGFALTGRKISVWDAPSAHYLIVSAAVDGGQSLSLFFGRRDAPGLTRHDYRLIDGTQCADIDMQSVAATLLLSGRQAAERLDEAADRLRWCGSRRHSASWSRVLDLTADYLRNRRSSANRWRVSGTSASFGGNVRRRQGSALRIVSRSRLYRSARAYPQAAVSAAKVVGTRQAVWWAH